LDIGFISGSMKVKKNTTTTFEDAIPAMQDVAGDNINAGFGACHQIFVGGSVACF